MFGVIATMFFATSLCFGAEDDSDDFETRGTVGFNWKMNQRWRLTGNQSARFKDDSSNRYYSHTEIGLVYKEVLPDLDLGVSYRSIFGHERGDEGNQEQRSSFAAYWKGGLFGADASNRTMLEYRDMKSSDNIWRLRHRVIFNKPFEDHAPEIARHLRERGKFYLGDEIFVNFQGEGFNRNRLIFGYQFKLVKNTIADIHYHWQLDKDKSAWDQTHILGFSVRYNF